MVGSQIRNDSGGIKVKVFLYNPLVNFLKLNTPALSGKKFLLAKNDLHVMKRILYDTGRRTVVRWPHKRRQKLEVVSYGEMTPDPPKN